MESTARGRRQDTKRRIKTTKKLIGKINELSPKKRLMLGGLLLSSIPVTTICTGMGWLPFGMGFFLICISVALPGLFGYLLVARSIAEIS